MRLAVISEVAGYPWAGSEELWLVAARQVLSDGGAVTAALHRDLHGARPLEALKAAGGKVVEWKRPRIARLGGLQQRFSPNFSAARLGNPEVILLSAGSLPSMVNLPGLMSFLRAARIPWVVLCQFNADCLPLSPGERSDIRWLLEGAAKCVFVSHHNQQLAERQCAIHLPCAEVIYNPIRTVLEAPLPARNDDRVVFGCVARMESLWKGQDVLLEVLAKPEWKARDWSLRFYGDGPDRAYLEEWTRQCGLSDRVTFAGYVRSVEEIWSACDLMVLASRGEGTPLAVLEAMMCGRPVVTTDVGGNAEVIQDGVSGFIAEAATPRSVGAALEKAWNVRERWVDMGKAGHRGAVKFAAENPGAELAAVICKILPSYPGAVCK